MEGDNIHTSTFQAIGSPIENDSAADDKSNVLNRVVMLKERVQLEKTKLKQVNDRNMHDWWAQFKEMMTRFKSIKEDLICKDKPQLEQLLDELKAKLKEV